MNKSAKRTYSDTKPPNQFVISKNIIKPPAKPYPYKTAELMEKENDAINSSHITQSVAMCDQPAGEGD